MRFQVPQFIETETKIIGPFTLKQFLFLAAGGALIFIVQFLFKNPAIAWVIGIPIAGIAAALAFYKIDGVPLPRYILMALSFLSGTKKYEFRKNDTPDIPASPAGFSLGQEGLGDIERRAEKLGEAMIELANSTPQNKVTVPLISNLMASGKNLGVNYCEANLARSKEEFDRRLNECRLGVRQTNKLLRMVAVAMPELTGKIEESSRKSTELLALLQSSKRF